jgi:three-Cys-motif partner protein
VNILHPYGLHFAFIDPFSLGALDFRIIKSLAQLKRIDMLIHVSAMDLQRNLDANLGSASDALDRFAPGWRGSVDLHQSQLGVRRQVVDYWRSSVATLGKHPSTRMELITGAGNQPLYWLLLAASNDLAHRFWNIATDKGQGDLF